MAAGNFIQEFTDEITCSICLDYFKDPVMIDCGHNFCQSCLTKCWEKSSTDPSCPQCRAIFQQQSFKPNRQLANILGIVKKFEDGKRPEKMREVCKMHQEPLKLFCKNDLSLMCVVCDRSKNHEKHSILPMEEAHQEYKEKIPSQLRFLKEERWKCITKKSSEDARTQSVLKKLEEDTKKSASAFKQMLTFLENNKDSWLNHVEYVKENFKETHKKSSIRLCEEISSIEKLIKEMEGKCQQPTNEFLQDIKSILNRYEMILGKQKMEDPFSYGWSLSLGTWIETASALEKIFNNCKGSLEKVLPKVILDPDTAHPQLSVSHDLQSVEIIKRTENLSDNLARFDKIQCVLGAEKFTTGKHQWVVFLKGEGAVGVARESVKRKEGLDLNPNEGIWAVQKKNSSWHVTALTSPDRTVLDCSHEPKKILVLLNIEEGSVSFWDTERRKSIFTFSSASFSGETICPFFMLVSGRLRVSNASTA